MDNVSVGEGQCLHTADVEVLASVSEADSRNAIIVSGDRDTRAGAIGLAVEEHHIAAARTCDCIAAVGADMNLLVVAASNQGAASVSGVPGTAGVERVAATRTSQRLLMTVTGEQHILRSVRHEDVTGSGAAVQCNSVECPGVQRVIVTAE